MPDSLRQAFQWLPGVPVSRYSGRAYYECRRCGETLVDADDDCPHCEECAVASYELD